MSGRRFFNHYIRKGLFVTQHVLCYCIMCARDVRKIYSAAEIKRGYNSSLINKYVGASENAAETPRWIQSCNSIKLLAFLFKKKHLQSS